MAKDIKSELKIKAIENGLVIKFISEDNFSLFSEKYLRLPSFSKEALAINNFSSLAPINYSLPLFYSLVIYESIFYFTTIINL